MNLLSGDYPRYTEAAILVEQKKPLEIARIELPSTLELGQVLIEFHFSGICGSQLGEIDGVKGPDRWLPHLLGHEATGKVLATGPGVKHVKAGDLVVAHWRPSMGIEATPAKYLWAGRTVNAGWITTFNKHAVISENRLTPIPASTDPRSAALYGCAVTTGFGVIDNRARVRLGETVIVFGAGGIGLNIVQAASLAGAAVIVAVDLFDNRLALAKRCGATHIINGLQPDIWEQIAKSLNGQAPDVFIDNTGRPEIIGRGYETVSARGRVILVGVPSKGANASLHTLPLHFGKQIVGTTGGEAMPHEDIPRYLGLMKSRGINLMDLITEVAPLCRVNQLIANMRTGNSAGRCLIDLTS